MVDSIELNEIIIHTIDQLAPDNILRVFLKKAIKYELDIWKRHVIKSDINTQYNIMLEKTLKEQNK